MNGRYIKPATTCYSPSRILTVVCETVIAGSESECKYEIHELRRVHTAYVIRRNNQWCETLYRTFDTGEEFHDYLECLAVRKKCLYVCSPIASESLRLTGFWDRITIAGSRQSRNRDDGKNVSKIPYECGTYVFSALVLNGKPDIIRYHRGAGSLCWFSGHQYFDSDEKEIFKCVPYIATPDVDGLDSDVAASIRAKYSVRCWSELLKKLSDWWLSVRGGPWGLTAGQMAMSYFRTRLQPKTLVSHNNDDATQLEHNAIYGGRASTWYYGDINCGVDYPMGHPLSIDRPDVWPICQPIHHIDIRSMYPFILSSCEFPTRILPANRDMRISTVRGLCDNYCVIARVVVNTNIPEYPCRYGGRIIYPCGRFSTTLCGSELRSAIDEGQVENVTESYIYTVGRPFKQMADDLLRLRADYRSNGMVAWEMFVKLLSNSFGGKLAQRAKRWVARPDAVALRPWGDYPTIDAQTGEIRRWRAIAGMVSECLIDPSNRRQLGACFAYLTMYGRVMMRKLRETMSSMSIVSQDTDGLWITSDGLTECRNHLDESGDVPGMPRLQYTCHYGKFWSPKHYWTERGWVLSGYHNHSVDTHKMTISHTVKHASVLGSPVVPPSIVRIEHTSKNLRPMFVDGVIQPNNWTIPLLLR